MQVAQWLPGLWAAPASSAMYMIAPGALRVDDRALKCTSGPFWNEQTKGNG